MLHSTVLGQKYTAFKKLLVNHSLCYIITKSWIQSFCQLVFFQLAQVLCFFLEMSDRRPHWSELMHFRFWLNKALFQIKSLFIVTSPQHECLGEWNSWERAPDSAKKTEQFTYRQYIFTDCTEDNVQNTHTQYTQCTIKTYLVTNTPYVHILHYVHIYT